MRVIKGSEDEPELVLADYWCWRGGDKIWEKYTKESAIKHPKPINEDNDEYNNDNHEEF